MSQSSDETDQFSSLFKSSGEASDTWKKAKKLSEQSKEVISMMDYFKDIKDEPSILFQFVEVMLIEVNEGILAMKLEPDVPKDLVRNYELAFRDFNRTSVQLGSLALASNPELFPQPDFDKVTADFRLAVGKLDLWTNEFLESEYAKIEIREAEIIESRKDSFSLIGIACVAYLLIMLAVGYVIQRSFLNPIRRMAHAADEALSEKRSFTQSSLKGNDSGGIAGTSPVKTLFQKETGPQEIETLSRRLWQLVHKLEEAVKERTGQLAERTEKLEVEIENRKKLETDLQHAQKMEAVGQMASGIAHEIRTPAQFAGDHLSFLKHFVDESFQQDIFSKLEFSDPAFLKTNVPVALESIRKGLEHITEIVSAMKRFSYKDTHASLSPADINSIVRDCVSISRNEWKNSAVLDTDLASDLPMVPCRLSEISQVIINLIVNASHSIADFHKGSMGKITVKTREENSSWIRISVEDNGGGIPVNVVDRVFDPFFTTKKVGVGSGQGLAISYNLIVERHKGKIDFDTTEGEGTVFNVLLPLTEVDGSGSATEEVAEKSPD
ncbi:MAG: HAMP domain-containing histidine kinase [Opitutae bacterium]|nr:HAMP domain-containing histidine kinase [Opitutae bacterium]